MSRKLMVDVGPLRDPRCLPVKDPVEIDFMVAGVGKGGTTQVMREPWQHSETGPTLARVRPRTQVQFPKTLRLRRRFDGGLLSWPEAARPCVVEALRDDAARLFDHYGTPFDFRPRCAAACADDRSGCKCQRIP